MVYAVPRFALQLCQIAVYVSAIRRIVHLEIEVNSSSICC